MRKIDQLIVHCAATKPSMDIGVEDIRHWHVDERGWDDVGYHYVIRRDGTIEPGRDVAVAGAHAYGHNAHSLGVCLVGGLSEDNQDDCNFTMAQYFSLAALLETLLEHYPRAAVMGHRDLPNAGKACPCFDVRAFMEARR